MSRHYDLLNAIAMREWFGQFKRTGHCWVGTIQPRANGMEFTIEIDDRFVSPKVRVLNPPLVNEPGKSVPKHHFADRTMCLHHPTDDGWDTRKPLALTILPWIFEWCYFYELWLDTGVWYGVEYEHSRDKPEPDNVQRSRGAAA